MDFFSILHGFLHGLVPCTGHLYYMDLFFQHFTWILHGFYMDLCQATYKPLWSFEGNIYMDLWRPFFFKGGNAQTVGLQNLP